VDSFYRDLVIERYETERRHIQQSRRRWIINTNVSAPSLSAGLGSDLRL
jgi:hypothetical protein